MITEREPTQQERAKIAGGGCLGCFGVLFIALSLAFSGVAMMLEGRAFWWVGSIIGGSIASGIMLVFLPVELKYRKLMRDRSLKVQEIEVVSPRIVEIMLISDNEPILVFDIGEGKLLFLQGQWLRDAETYGVDPKSMTDDGEHEKWSESVLNGLPPPHSFPSSQFRVTREKQSGKVLRIDAIGRYIRPEKTVDALRPEFDFLDSEIFEGKLEEIAEVMMREHKRLKPTRKNLD